MTAADSPKAADSAGGADTRIGAVVPAHQAAGQIGACLDALLAAGLGAREVLVVDDASTDGTGDAARARGVEVLRKDRPARPAAARNAGVAALACDIVVFVDADVLVHRDVRSRLAARFAADPGLAAVFGSYDAAPPAPGLVSRYRNLLHHFTHQTAPPAAATFWTGLGAVRREVFLEIGGFARAWEDIEDVEFGLRATAAGHRIALDRAIQGAHLKAWTLRSMVRTDLHGRARPWTRLLRRRVVRKGVLNTAPAHRVAAASIAGALGAVIAALAWPPALLAALAALGVFLCATAPFLVFLGRLHGPLFAAYAVPVHALHYLAALAGYLWVVVLERSGAPERPGESLVESR